MIDKIVILKSFTANTVRLFFILIELKKLPKQFFQPALHPHKAQT